MKKIFLLLLLAPWQIWAQSTFSEVYTIFQNHCVSCHDNASPDAGLDLEGAGATLSAKQTIVYNNLVNVAPSNAVAAAKGDKRVYKGRADKSFLFRKVNVQLDTFYHLDAGEGALMPNQYPNMIPQAEQELIRQWILYGAPATGTVVDPDVLTSYFEVGGQEAFPEGAPEAPAPSEGFQIKMGPFYLPPGGEVEYYQKWETFLPSDIEVARLDMKLSPYSHHFIVYHFTTPTGANSIPAGLRTESYHNNIGLTAAVQEATDLHLPQGTAFKWTANRVLDLNSHYINYSQTMPYRCEVYINVYTQPTGTAAQEMHSDLIVNPDIYIPNSGNPVNFSDVFTSPSIGEVFVWGLMGHTHKYGTDYKVYRREANGQQGEMLYDGSCPFGTPGCSSPWYDYQHIPLRLFEPLVPLNMGTGLIHKASYLNDGPEAVWFGPTSADEMMVLIAFYTADSTGIINADSRPLAEPTVGLYPNPAGEQVRMNGVSDAGTLEVYAVSGALMLRREVTSDTGPIATDNLPVGMYVYTWRDARTGRTHSGRLLIQR